MIKDIFKTNHQAVFIAEIGLNHNGDIDLARGMVDSAAKAGADAVKFQVFVPELMNSVYTSSLLEHGEEKYIDKSQVDFFSKFTLRKEDYAELKSFAEELGIVFFASVFDIRSVEMIEGFGVGLYKLASSEVTNHPLIRAVADTGKPLILSTGISTEEEIEMAINVFRKNSGADLMIMHCVSQYPAQAEGLNIGRISSLRERFGVETGFSDHSLGITAPILAAGQGVKIFEKHFTIDRLHECPDKDISLDPDEFSLMVNSVEEAIRMIGTGEIPYGSSEKETAKAARRSLFAARSIKAGKIIEESDLIALRPGVGIPVYRMNDIVGKISKVDIKKDFIIKKEYFD